MPPSAGGMTVLCGYIPDKIPGIPQRAALFAGRRYAECVGIGESGFMMNSGRGPGPQLALPRPRVAQSMLMAGMRYKKSWLLLKNEEEVNPPLHFFSSLCGNACGQCL